MQLNAFRSVVHDSRGMALVLCLMLMTTLCLIGGAALSVSDLNRRIVQNNAKYVQVFYVAEAGRQMALAHLSENPLWRGGQTPPGLFGEMDVEGFPAVFSVTLSDCTADGNGDYNAMLPAGHVRVHSTGTWFDASRRISCIACIRPSETSMAAFPLAAVLTSGAVSGSLAALDAFGSEDSQLLKEGEVLPEANGEALQAMADMWFPDLDDDAFDASLGSIDLFWGDALTETRPHIYFVQGDIDIKGDRCLYGIVYVGGETVTLAEESAVQGILYAPFATSVVIQNSGTSGRVVVKGQIVTGPAGVEVTGNPVSIQVHSDYIAAFNNWAGALVNIDSVPGSWSMP